MEGKSIHFLIFKYKIIMKNEWLVYNCIWCKKIIKIISCDIVGTVLDTVEFAIILSVEKKIKTEL